MGNSIHFVVAPIGFVMLLGPCFVVYFCVLSSLAIISLRKSMLVALLLLWFGCLCLFFKVLCVGLRSRIVAFSGHSHYLFEKNQML